MANGHGGSRPGAGRGPWTPEQRAAASARRRAEVQRARTPVAPPSETPIPAQPRRSAGFNTDAILEIMQISQQRAAAARGRKRTADWNPFRMEGSPTQHGTFQPFPTRAMPPEKRKLRMAQDDALVQNNQFAFQAWMNGGMLSSAVSEGLVFLGYPVLSELAQRPEFRLFGEIQAEEMTRKWIEFRGTDDESTKDEDKPKQRNEDDDQRERERRRNDEGPRSDSRNKEIEAKIRELTDYLEEMKLKAVYKEAVIQDRFFGIAHPYIDLKGVNLDDPRDPNIRSPIGNGRDSISAARLTKDCLNGFRVIEPIWCYPTTYNAQNPLRSDWYNPEVWYVMGTEIHRSRLLSFIGRPVPDILKPAYAFGGLSMTQMAQPYVDIWLRTRESVGEIIHAFSVMVLMTDLGTVLQPGGAGGGGGDVLARLALFNEFRDNQGVFAISKSTEDFKNVSAPISGLDELQAQSQEHMFSVGRIPAVKFAGIQPKGLNATSEGELRAFYDTIHGYQEHFRAQLTTMIDVAQISLFGARDPDITYDFLSLHELTDKEKAEVRKIDAETTQIYIDSGQVSQEEARAKLVADPESGFHGLDPDDVPDLLEEEEQGLEPVGGRPQPAAGAGGPPKAPKQPGEREPDPDDDEAEDVITPNFDKGGGRDAIVPFEDEEAVAEVQRRDRLGYLKGVKHVRSASDHDQWNASYDPDTDTIEIEGKTEARPLAERVNIALHEGGHRGQFKTDPDTYRAFRRHGLDKHEFFLEIANPTHIHDFEKTHRVYDEAGEIFAESYSRACLGMKLPEPLQAFWDARFREGAADAWWHEEEHPRGEGGKFSSGGSSGGGSKQKITAPQYGMPHGSFTASAHTPFVRQPMDPKKIAARMDAHEAKATGTPAERREAARRITSLSDRDITEAAGENSKLAAELIARRDAIKAKARMYGNEGDPKAAASSVVIPAGGKLPVKALNGVAFKEWAPPEGMDWADVDGQAEIDEPEFVPGKDKSGKDLRPASGVVIREKDGRVWLMQPSNGFGGYEGALPKGGVDPGLSPQANAIKEAWEETGLKVKITGFAGDHDGDTSTTRYYYAERETGDPSKPTWETEGVVLVPQERAHEFLNRSRDKKVLAGDEFHEADHPRDQGGKFTSGGGAGGAGKGVKAAKGPAINPSKMKKVSAQKGSNPGGVYEDTESGNKFYVKHLKSAAHKKNEYTAAGLYQLAGVNTLDYVPTSDDTDVATHFEKLNKGNASELTPAEKQGAFKDFAVHAWLANWDAIGTGGDNVGILKGGGSPAVLDVGGALEFRAQGGPKGSAFGTKVTELESMLDPNLSPDATNFYNGMSYNTVAKSVDHVAHIRDDDIRMTVEENGGSPELAEKLIARKYNMAKEFGLKVIEEVEDPEFASKHPRNPDGTFKKGAGENFGAGVASEPAPPEQVAGKKPVLEGVPQAGAFMGQWIHDADPVKAFEKNFQKIISEPTKKFQHYRTYLTTMLKLSHQYGKHDVTEALKKKLAESLTLTAANLTEKGKHADAAKVIKQLNALGGAYVAPKAAAAPAPAPKPAAPAPAAPKPAAPPPPVAPKPSSFPAPTEAEIAKAKKNVKLQPQYLGIPDLPTTPAINAAIAEFNTKYEGKTLTEQAALIQKVNDFKALQAKVAALAGPEKEKQLKAQAEAAAKQEEANKAAAEELKKAKQAGKAKNKEYMKELGISETEADGFHALVDMMGGGNDVMASFKSQKAQAEKYGYPMSGFQAALIKNYTNGGYGSINKALRSESWTPQQHVYARLMNKALDAMPKFEGTVKRGTSLTPEQLAKYKPGQVVQEHSFTSTGEGFSFGGEVKYTIKAIGKRGASVKKLSNHASENEVVFKANTYFLVHSVKKVGGATHIEMEEIEGLHE